jgi:hypothetical protein
MGGHDHDRERGVQALSFFQDVEPIAVRQAQVQYDSVEAMVSKELDGAGDGAGNGDVVAIMVQQILHPYDEVLIIFHDENGIVTRCGDHRDLTCREVLSAGF